MKHTHDHYPPHSAEIKHRIQSLNPAYPTKHAIVRLWERIEKKMRARNAGEPFQEHMREMFKERLEKGKLEIGVDVRGRSIEIYMDTLLPDIAKERERWYLPEDNDGWLIILFIMRHHEIYIHEILHRTWFWNSTYIQNRHMSLQLEERVVELLSEYITWSIFRKKEYVDKLYLETVQNLRKLARE